MTKLVTFCDHRMTISANKCASSAMKFGTDAYSIWTPGDLSAEFCETQAALVNAERGPMWWAWKPYVIHREICKAQDGDIIVYADAGNEWVADMRTAIAAMDQDILLFSNGWRHVDWCKMDVIAAINPDLYIHLATGAMGLHEQAEAHQVQASTFFVKVTPFSRKFIQEWYAWSLMPGLVDNEPSRLQNVATFQEHRHDQSLITALQQKYKIRQHWFPSTVFVNQRHKFPNDHYPAMLNHHRKRNNQW